MTDAGSERPRRAGYAGWCLALLGLHVAWRVVRAAMVFPLWGDEARVAVNLIDRGPLELMQPLDWLQVVPVGFLWAEWAVVQVAGSGETALRALPVAAGLAGTFVLLQFLWRTLDPRRATLAFALFAGSYYPVRHATEVKPYSLDLLCSAALVLAGHRLVSALDGSGGTTGGWQRQAAGFGALGAVAVWFSYPAAFVVGGVGLTALAAAAAGQGSGVGPDAAPDRIRRIAGVGLACAVAAASFAVHYLLVGRGQAAAGAFLLTLSHWQDQFPPLDRPWLLPLWLLQVHTGNLFAYPNGGNEYGSAATFLVFVVGVSALVRARSWPLLGLMLGPFVMTFAASCVRAYPYGGSARIAQHLVPAVCIGCGVGVAAIASWARAPRTGARIWLLLMAAFAVGGIHRSVTQPYKHRSDPVARGIIEDLAAASAPGDRWAVFGALEAGDPWAPPLPRVVGSKGWGGTFARLQYYLQHHAQRRGVELLWAPPPSSLARGGGAVVLLEYHDNTNAFPAARFARYLDAVRGALGRPADRVRTEQIDRRGPETLTFHVWDAPETDPGSPGRGG